MIRQNEAKMFIKKLEGLFDRRGVIDAFYILDIIRNEAIAANDPTKEIKFALDAKLKISTYKNKLMPNAYKDEIIGQALKTTPLTIINNHKQLENITEELTVSQFRKHKDRDKESSAVGNNNKEQSNFPIKNVINSSLTKHPKIVVNGAKESKFCKLSSITSKYNNFVPGDSEVPYIPDGMKNSIGTPRQRSTVLTTENMVKKEMFTPMQLQLKKTQMNFTQFNMDTYNEHFISGINNSNIPHERNKNKLKSEKRMNINNYGQINPLYPKPINPNNISSILSNNLMGNNSYNNLQMNKTQMRNKQIPKYKGGASSLNLIRIGDIVLLRYNFKTKNAEITSEGILCPEKIISKRIFCLSMNKIEDVGSGRSIFKRSLFRIENPQSYICQYQYETAKKMKKERKHDDNMMIEEENTHELAKLAYEEKKGNESEFQLNYGNEVAYGQIIQLRNIFTNELLVVDLLNISKEIGCLDLILNPLGGQIAWFKLVPSHKIRNLGECVSYLDDFYIMPTCIETESYMHVNHNDEDKTTGMEVNISSRKNIFKFSLFESAEEVRKGKMKNVAKSTSAIKIYNQEYEGYITADFKQNNLMLPRLKTDKRMNNQADNSFDEDMITNTVDHNTKYNNQTNDIADNFNMNDLENDYMEGGEAYSALGVKRASTYTVSIHGKVNDDTCENCNTYWEIQYDKPYEGKVISCGCPIRFRHISSGLYLSFNPDSKEIGLSQTLDNQTVFYVYSDTQENNLIESPIMNGNQVYFSAKETDYFLKVNTNKMIDSKYTMLLSREDKMEYAKMIFKIELITNSLVKINYNVALTIHHLRNLYDDVNNWGMKLFGGEEIGRGYVYDYHLALEGESKFGTIIALYNKILKGVQEEASTNNPESIHFKQFQNFHSDQGFISLLLNFIMLFDSKSISSVNEERMVKEKSSPEKIATRYTKNAIALSFEVIRLLITDNPKSSQSIYSSINLISKLFDYHKLEVIQILIICLQNTNEIQSEQLSFKEFYKRQTTILNPSNTPDNTVFKNLYAQIGFWKSKMAELSEKKQNLVEQKLFIQIMQMLCLDSNGNGIFANQMEIKVKLYENDIFPLKFGMDDDQRPFVIFNSKLSFDDFFNNNPSLTEIKRQKNNFKDVPMFYYDMFDQKYQDYIDYICAVLDLYYASCVSRNQMNIHIISDSKHVGLIIAHIWLVANDIKIAMPIRYRYIKLFRVLYIDSEPFIRISKFRLKVFIWKSKLEEPEDLVSYIYKWFSSSSNADLNGGLDREKFDFVKKHVKDFFKKVFNVEHLVDMSSIDEITHNKEMFKNVLCYINEIFILTKELIDFGYFKLTEINELLVGFAYFFSIFEKYNPNDQKKSEDDNNSLLNDDYSMLREKANNKRIRSRHWLANIAYECLESEYSEVKANLFVIYESCITILNIICTIKEDLQIYQFLKLYKDWYYDGSSLTDNTELLKVYHDISNDMNILDFNIKDNEPNDLNDSYVKEEDEDKEQTMIPLDIYLLGVLFNDYDNEFSGHSLDNKALELLIKYFNEYENLKKQLTTIEIIVNSDDTAMFNSLTTVNCRIIDLKGLLYRDYVCFQIYQNSEKQGNLNRLHDLTRIIEVDLIAKLDLKATKKLCKIQNMCRHLKLHETLIDLSNFLLTYDKNLPVFKSIFEFLYHFCYRNYHNQLSMKHYFIPFLNKISNYKFICEVLTEILNLYKETPKSKKYIDIIFDKITQDNEISSEEIDVLRSLTINYKDENIPSNQGMIIQNFLYHSKFIKMNFTEEDKRELDHMMVIIKQKQSNSSTMFKKVTAQIKFIELLSSCSIENTFCILNCRRLVKVEDLMKYLLSHEVPYACKPAYLAFFMNVFYPSIKEKTDQSYNIQYAIDVLEQLVLPELNIFYFYCGYFIDLRVAKTPKDNPMHDKLKGAVLELNDLFIRKIKEDESIKDILTLNIIDFTILESAVYFNTRKYLTDHKKSEYINFLLSDNHNYNLKQEGVMIFIYELFSYISKNNIDTSLIQQSVINRVKDKISELLEFLSVLEEKLGEDDKITEIEYAIQRCISMTPKSKYDKIVGKIAYAKKRNKIGLDIPIEEEKSNDDHSNNSDDELNIDKQVEGNAKKVLKLIQEFLIMNETNVTGIFHLLDTDNDKQIDKFEFKRNLKLLLNSKVTNDEIEDTMNYIDSNQDEKISLKELSVKLYKFSKETQKKTKYDLTDLHNIQPFLDLETKLDDKSFKISSIFKHFILAFHEIQEKIGKNLEIGDLVKKLSNFLIQDNQGDFMKKFLDCLKSSFHKKKYKIYLLRIMYELINNKILDIDEDNQEKYSMINKIQSQLNSSGVTEFVMSLIDKSNSNDVIEESLNLMILLLKNGNIKVQNTVYAYLSNPTNTFTFLSFVRELLHSAVNHLKNKLNIKEYENSEGKGKQFANFYQEMNKYYNKSIDLSQIDLFYNFSTEQIEKKLFMKDEQKYFRIPEKILLFLQLLCENCYENFQHFLRDQEFNREDKDKISSVNIVYEIGNLLISLLNFGNTIYSDIETMKLINQAFLTLADLCLGPCKENQILLGSRRTMFKMINNLLRNDYNFHIKEQTHRKKNMLMCRAIIFLKTLINRETLKQVGRTLLDEIDIFLLIEKLIDIFEMKINPNISLLYSGHICDHNDKFKKIFKEVKFTCDKRKKKGNSASTMNTCKRTDCVKGYISQTDIKYINTGFDIFIILTSLQDVFPDHPKLSWFKFRLNLPGMQVFNMENTKHAFKSSHSFQHNMSKRTNIPNSLNNTSISVKSKDSKDNDNKTNNSQSEYESLSKKDLDNSNVSQFGLNKTLGKKFRCLCCCRFFGKRSKTVFGYDYNYENIAHNDDIGKLKTVKNKKEKGDNDVKKRFMIKYREYFNDTYLFFAKNISNVEIFYRGDIVKTYFKIPFLFKFLPDETKSSIIWESQYDNHQARLEALFKQITQVKKDLIHQQNLSSFRSIFQKWHWINTTSFVLSLMTNVILFSSIRNSDIEDCNIGRDDCIFISMIPEYHYVYPQLLTMIMITEYFKIGLNVIALIFLIINQYPVINSKLEKYARELNLKLNEQRIKKYSGSILFFFLYEFMDKISEKRENVLIKLYKTKGINLFFDNRVIIFLLYILVSFFSIFFTPFFNLAILVDILRRSEYLLDVFHAIQLNFKQLILTIIFLIAVIYAYAVLLFFTMRQYFNSVDYMGSPSNEVDVNAYCDKIYNCFLSIIQIGITTQKGLNIIGGELFRTSPDFWIKYVIDVSFFFVVMLFIFNIIFSVIINSFRELRDQLKLKEKMVKEYCFVCGVAKYIFEIKGNGWVSHYKYEHNVFAYLYYVIELEEKEMNDCDGLEKYVKGCIEKEDYTFLPLNQALSIKEKQTVEQGDSETELDEIHTTID